jgi:RNA recognition motif-containing protein
MAETRRNWHTKPRKLSETATNSAALEERAPAFEAAMASTSKNTQGGEQDGCIPTAKKQDIVPTRQLKLRLFVGGLGPTVGPKDLQDRIAPLGQVHGIQMIDSKEDGGGDGTHRGFAYVDFEAFSDASLQKLFSAVRNSILLSSTLISKFPCFHRLQGFAYVGF